MPPAAGGRRRSVGFSYEGLTENVCRPLADFPEQPPVELVCEIGRGVLCDPVRSSECGHRYCRGCITEMLRSSPRCPVGACTTTVVAESMLLPMPEEHKRAQDLVAFCRERAKGCEWRGPQWAYEEHALTCKRNLPITCKMCSKRVPRDLMTLHITVDCPKLPARCEYCSWEGLASDLPRHLYHDCLHCPPEKVPQEPPPPPAPAGPVPAESTGTPPAFASTPATSGILRQSKPAWGESSSPPAAALPPSVHAAQREPSRELDVRKLAGKIDNGDLKGLRRSRGGAGSSSPVPPGRGQQQQGRSPRGSDRRGSGNAIAMLLAVQQQQLLHDSGSSAEDVPVPRSPKRSADLGLDMPRPAPDSPALRCMGAQPGESPRHSPLELDGPIVHATSGHHANPITWALVEQARTASSGPTGELVSALATCILDLEGRISGLEQERRHLRRLLKARKIEAESSPARDRGPAEEHDDGHAQRASASFSTPPSTSPAALEPQYQPVLVGSPRKRGAGSPSPRTASPLLRAAQQAYRAD
eukprot:TRINITY_DN3905_c2_g2_i2.p1 TRINITY_DN3905_c2_g2~~TRINITY_DN3905_c2_g2_i2.p1  ORF type:complete len:530 (+),score=149.96 TRINITY_DN3905_c2_g2_i2:307-1896(+)